MTTEVFLVLHAYPFFSLMPITSEILQRCEPIKNANAYEVLSESQLFHI